MRFTQNFVTDFDAFDFWDEPFAFVRFGDGERAICEGRPIEAQDGWAYDGQASQFATDLNAALRFNAAGYYIGISDAARHSHRGVDLQMVRSHATEAISFSQGREPGSPGAAAPAV